MSIKLSRNTTNQLGEVPVRSIKKQKYVKGPRNNGQFDNNGVLYFFYNFNLPAGECCPNAPQACRKICFAKSDEVKYSNGARACRQENFVATKHDRFVSEMIKIIDRKFELAKKRALGGEFKIYIRIHGSGDFYSKEYFEKWCEISSYFREGEKKDSICFMAYTKEIIMIDNYLQSNNFTLDDINIKIVFSEMSGYTDGTSDAQLEAYDRIKSQKAKNQISKYVVIPNIQKAPENEWCKLSGNIVEGMKADSGVDNIRVKLPICMLCKKCYEMSSEEAVLNMLELKYEGKKLNTH